MTDMNLAFSGGDAARDHFDAIMAQRQKIAEALHGDKAIPLEERRARRRAELDAARAALAKAEA